MIFYLYHNIMAVFIMMTGLYIVMSSSNLFKKLIGLNIFQVSALLLYIALSHINNARVPVIIIEDPSAIYHNPLPHVLMLTAIVVGISTIVVGMAISCRIYNIWGSIDGDDLQIQEDEE